MSAMPALRRAAAALVLSLAGAAASAATITDFTDPTAPTISLPDFDVAEDRFRFQLSAFGLSGGLTFANGLAANLPDTGQNLIVLQDSDDDANAATAFNARSAARLIAGALDDDRGGFFVYFNSVLNINRLVFSANLNNGDGALAILAAIQSPTGQEAVGQLPLFTARNFAALAEPVSVAPVPVPAALPLMGGALLSLAFVRRRRAR